MLLFWSIWIQKITWAMKALGNTPIRVAKNALIFCCTTVHFFAFLDSASELKEFKLWNTWEMDLHNSISSLKSCHKSRLRNYYLSILQITIGNISPYLHSNVLIQPGFQQSLNHFLSIKCYFVCRFFLIYFSFLWRPMTW